ncbi:carboxylesterase family protein [Maribellus maritimus]|uniref:carboxylesterase family protein n=1 Tax=Maribellus maritimus TaxID=2870838 RepID=UPI001EE9EABB|nr:carboxylesterase family protein [Maribellus maritimus]MCG6190510.1 carboxylesterase family protein [Maribellus maritimus]
MTKDIIFQTPSGEIIGMEYPAVIRATGIPYAIAKRFEKPETIGKYAEPVNATQPAPACLQNEDKAFSNFVGENILKDIKQSEDCLNLSVTRPNSEQKNLPVMVWIHGGSYIAGAGDAFVFDPEPMAAEQNVIVVAVTYRLGLFGFLGNYNNIPPNFGYLDLVEALRWINKNIESFGGNPQNVTLFGQSAGGDAVAQMMLIEETKSLFHNVIIQSAPFGLLFNKAKMIDDMITVAKSLPQNASKEKILSKQLEVLTAAKSYGLKAGMPFGVQYGAYPFPKEADVYKVWKERAKNINILAGYTKSETALYVPMIPQVKKVCQIPLLGKVFKQLFVEITTNIVYKKDCKKFAQNCVTATNNVYQYEILWGSKTNGFGAAHTIDIPLLFGESTTWENRKIVEGITAEEIDKKGKEVRKMWAVFAENGRLGHGGEIEGVLKYRKKNAEI